MFDDSVTRRLLKIENEQRAQKIAGSLNYGSLAQPDSIPTASWSGNVQNRVDTATGLNARFVATFTRTDGIDLPPMVSFPYDYSLARYYYDDTIASGAITSVSGRDKQAQDEFNFNDALYEVGSNYVKWKIEIDNQWYYQMTDGTTVNLTVQANSPVAGVLTLERTV